METWLLFMGRSMNSPPSCLSHSPVDAPVGWFYLLALGGDASVQIYVQVFGWPCAFISLVLFIFPRYGGVESLDYRVVLCLPFGVTATIFPAAAPSCIPTTNVQGLQFLHILTSTGYFPFCFI